MKKFEQNSKRGNTDWVTDWQAKAMIGLEVDKNVFTIQNGAVALVIFFPCSVWLEWELSTQNLFHCLWMYIYSDRFKAWSLFSVLSHLVQSDFMILLFLFGLYFWINAFYIYFEYFRSIRILIKDSVLNVCLCSQQIIGTLFRRVRSMYILNEFNLIETNTVDDFNFWKRLAMYFTKGWKGMSLVSFMTI